MKAVILEIKKGYAAALKEDGTVVKIKARGAVGDTIELNERDLAGYTRPFKISRVIAIAAAVVLIVSLGTTGYFFTSTAATVVIDTGVSEITLSVNHFDQVIGMESSNEDDEIAKALTDSGIRYHSFREALEIASAAIKNTSTETDANTSEIQIHSTNERTYEKILLEAENNGFTINTSTPAEDAALPSEQDQQTLPNINDITQPDQLDQQVQQDQQTQPGQQVQPDQQTQPSQQVQPDQQTQPGQQVQPDQQAVPEDTIGSSQDGTADQIIPDNQGQEAPADITPDQSQQQAPAIEAGDSQNGAAGQTNSENQIQQEAPAGNVGESQNGTGNQIGQIGQNNTGSGAGAGIGQEFPGM